MKLRRLARGQINTIQFNGGGMILKVGGSKSNGSSLLTRANFVTRCDNKKTCNGTFGNYL